MSTVAVLPAIARGLLRIPGQTSAEQAIARFGKPDQDPKHGFDSFEPPWGTSGLYKRVSRRKNGLEIDLIRKKLGTASRNAVLAVQVGLVFVFDIRQPRFQADPLPNKGAIPG
jgi:hypothetical protein